MLRRRPGASDGIEPVGYARLLAPMLGLWIFASATETVRVPSVAFWVDEPGEFAREHRAAVRR